MLIALPPICRWASVFPEDNLNVRGVEVATSPLALTLSALALVWVLSGEATPRASLPPAEAPSAPTADVPGVDVPGLPRYPGSTRVAYSREVKDGLVSTRARYVVAAELDAVRGFYRQVFQAEGWSEVDARFSPDRWSFLVVSGDREARVRIKSEGGLVEIAIGLGEPTVSAASSAWAGRTGSRRPGPS